MSFQQHPGAVIYAKRLDRLVEFYARAVGFEIVERSDEYAVLDSGEIQLVVLQAPARIADSITISDPPTLRENTPIKLVFFTEIDPVRRAAPRYGGAMNSSASEWQFHEMRVCDGSDPEGNIFQVRESGR